MNWMTVHDVADYLQLSTMMVYKLAQEGRIPAAKIGRIWRFEKNTIDNWLKAGMSGASKNLDEMVVAEFSSQLKKILGENLVRLVIFGSHARGDAGENSDLDVLVVVKSAENYWRLHAEIEKTAYDVTFGSGKKIVLSPIIMDEEEYLTGMSPLILNIRKEGKIAA